VLANFLLGALRADIGHYSFIRLRIQQENEAVKKNTPRSSASEALHKLLEQNEEVLEGKHNTKFIFHTVHFSILQLVQPVSRVRQLRGYDALLCETNP
jgi:hypothetical protein